MAPYFKKCIPPLLLFLLLLFLSGCHKAAGEVPAPKKETRSIRITLAGDFLMHMPVVNSARTAGGGYDFKEIFKEVSPYLADPDFTVVNLETRLAGPARGYSGYPRFNTPAALAADMKALGIDLVATANNHSMDMGQLGVITTLDNLDRAGLYHTGTYRSQAERDSPTYFDIGGIRVGFINCTQSTNGLPVPSGKAYMVNLIKRDFLLKEIDSLKENGCQFIIAFMHFGTEYQRQPNQFQKTLASELFNAGVDVVAGSHPHVLQPMEWHTIIKGGRERKALAAYSLGNFISNQQWRYSDCGMLLNLDIAANDDGTASLEGAGYIPVWVHRYVQGGRLKYRVLPVQEAIRNYQDGADPLLTEADYRRLQQAWRDTTGLMGPEFSPDTRTQPMVRLADARS